MICVGICIVAQIKIRQGLLWQESESGEVTKLMGELINEGVEMCEVKESIFGYMRFSEKNVIKQRFNHHYLLFSNYYCIIA